MSAFVADLNALADLIERIEIFTSRAEVLGGDVDTDVRRLHAQWSGAAAEAHLRAHDRWRRSVAQLRAAAEELRQVVAVAHGNYKSAASANLRMWS